MDWGVESTHRSATPGLQFYHQLMLACIRQKQSRPAHTFAPSCESAEHSTHKHICSHKDINKNKKKAQNAAKPSSDHSLTRGRTLPCKTSTCLKSGKVHIGLRFGKRFHGFKNTTLPKCFECDLQVTLVWFVLKKENNIKVCFNFHPYCWWQRWSGYVSTLSPGCRVQKCDQGPLTWHFLKHNTFYFVSALFSAFK